jgi:hypothetical protein
MVSLALANRDKNKKIKKRLQLIKKTKRRLNIKRKTPKRKKTLK